MTLPRVAARLQEKKKRKSLPCICTNIGIVHALYLFIAELFSMTQFQLLQPAVAGSM